MNVERAVEALLFVADAPAKPDEFARALQVPVFEVEDALERIGSRFHHNSGIQLVRIAGGYQLCTKSEYAEAVTRFLQPKKQKLSNSLLEVLAVIAYQQPITSAEIEAVRGVASDYALRQLLERRMITEIGRKNTPGRPILYGTTAQFLHAFQLDHVDELPQLSEEALAIVGETRPPEQPLLPSITEVTDR
jgi:segregation and condensation protein B